MVKNDLSLDVGCGAYPKANIGIDIHINNNIKKVAKTKGVELVIGDACNLPFRNNSFIKVECHGAINYFRHDHKFLCEAHRVLKTKGVLVLSCGSAIAYVLNYPKRMLSDPLGAFRLLLNWLRGIYHGYSQRVLKNKLIKNNFDIILVYSNVIITRVNKKSRLNIFIVGLKLATNQKYNYNSRKNNIH